MNMSVVHGRRIACPCGTSVEIPQSGDAVRLRCPACGGGFDLLSTTDTASAGPMRMHDAVEVARTPPPPDAFVDRSGGRRIRRVRLRLRTAYDWWNAVVEPLLLAALIAAGIGTDHWWLAVFGGFGAWGYGKRLARSGGAVRFVTIADGTLTYRSWYALFPATARVRVSDIHEIYAYEGRVFVTIRGGRTLSIGGDRPLDPVSLGWLVDHIRTGVEAARSDAARALPPSP